MRILLDRHVFLWWVRDDPRLDAPARDLISNYANEIFVSAVSAWEIEIKAALGKLKISPDWKRLVAENGFQWLPVLPRHTEGLRDLPPIHRDPFDRMLVAQARTAHLALLTRDPKVQAYLVPPPVSLRVVTGALRAK